MKIAVLLTSFPVISETFILNQITGLLDRGHDVHIHPQWANEIPAKIHEDVARYKLLERIEHDTFAPKSLVKRIPGALFKITRWGWRAPATTLDCFNILRHGRRAANFSLIYERLCFSMNYDVIHCHYGPNGNRAVALRKFGTLKGPIITSFHGYDVNQLPNVHGLDFYKELFSVGDHFTVGSNFMKNKIVALGANPQRVTKLPMGVDLAKFSFVERQKAPDRELQLVTVARLVEVKGLEYALLAVRTMINNGLLVRYRIAGDGPLRGKLESLSKQLDIESNVKFLGALTHQETIELYQSGDIFVLPSIVTESGEEEGQSVSLAEAQASGMPVVATTVGGIPETVDDGRSGLLVPPRDPLALSSALMWYAEHSEMWATMGRTGRAHVEANFSLHELNTRLETLYETVAEHTNTSNYPLRGA